MEKLHKLQTPIKRSGSGNDKYTLKVYAKALDLKYGEGTAKKLQKQAGEYFKTTRPFLEDLIRDCKEQIKFYEK